MLQVTDVSLRLVIVNYLKMLILNSLKVIVMVLLVPMALVSQRFENFIR